MYIIKLVIANLLDGYKVHWILGDREPEAVADVGSK